MGAMSLIATARSTPGSLRQEIVVDGRFRLFTDEPERLGGDDSAPSPHELVPAALAACVSTTLLVYARTKGWELGRVDVEVVYEPKGSPRRCGIAIRIERQLAAEQVARLEHVASTCPVRRTLEGAVEFSEQIVSGIGPGRLAA